MTRRLGSLTWVYTCYRPTLHLPSRQTVRFFWQTVSPQHHHLWSDSWGPLIFNLFSFTLNQKQCCCSSSLPRMNPPNAAFFNSAWKVTCARPIAFGSNYWHCAWVASKAPWSFGARGRGWATDCHCCQFPCCLCCEMCLWFFNARWRHPKKDRSAALQAGYTYI